MTFVFVFILDLQSSNIFQVNDKRAAWLKLRGLAAGNRWEDLLAFANEKKSPIGYEPFVEVCMSRSNFSAAESYCEKVTDHSRRSQLYLGVFTALHGRFHD
jgi:hypothetical protein